MEGQISKIRTMAQDLERSRLALRHAAQGLAEGERGEVSHRMVRGEPARPLRSALKKPKEPAEKIKEASTPQTTIEELLPIETIPLHPSNVSLEVKPILRPQIEPPANLPTEDSVRKLDIPTATERLKAPGEEPPLKSEAKKTPEELLGLSAEKPGQKPPALPAGRPAVRKRKPSSLKFAATISALGIIFAAIIAGIYWTIFIKQEQKPAPLAEPPPIELVEPTKPKSLMAYDSEQIIEIKNLSYNALKAEIDALQDITLPAESVARILIKHAAENEIKYLSLKEIFNILGIYTPPTLLNNEDFTFFLYVQGVGAQEACGSASITNNLCYGPRLGFVVSITDDNEGVLPIMRVWEETIAEDMRPLILNTPRMPEEYTLKTGVYKGITTHYVNLPIHTTSIDWLATDTHLILTTSRDAARAAADRLGD